MDMTSYAPLSKNVTMDLSSNAVTWIYFIGYFIALTSELLYSILRMRYVFKWNRQLNVPTYVISHFVRLKEYGPLCMVSNRYD